jgi:NADPH-dependent glutamate synthase beta subunit-like oxidoreductase
MSSEGFDAVFLAIGAQLSKRAYLPAGDSAKILDALGVLRDVAGGARPVLGRRVIVYGGGNTAMDAARTARRLGATETLVVYRRTREVMPANDVEVEEALQEGIQMRWLSTIAFAGSDAVKVEKMELHNDGKAYPTGEFEELAADAVVLAIGQDVDQSIVDGVEGVRVIDGSVSVGPDTMTGRPGVFAGGDVVNEDRTVTSAIGQGKRAARQIDGWLRAQAYEHPARPELASADRLHPWYYSDAPRTVRDRLDVARRVSTFDEVVQGLDEETAVFEARRCLSCGNCFGCDNCFGMCPDNAIIKLDPSAQLPERGMAGLRFAINLEYCKGCGICAAECPCGAIDMVPEQT